MRLRAFLAVIPLGNLLFCASAQQPFTLQQALNAPFSTALTAAPTGDLFAWVEDVEGRHNLYIGGKDTPARALTHNTEDDAQDISQLAWSPDASAIAYTYGAPSGADGKPANPAHLQRATPVTILLQPIAPGAKPIVIGEGRSPLFELDGHSLLFLRSGQILIACLKDCHPERSAQRGVEGPAIQSVAVESSPLSIHQLVFDRGNASSLTLSPDGHTLAFISHRREANEPSHSYLALFDLITHTLTFPAPGTGDDLSPAFSPDGKQIAWLRAPFIDVPEFALNRVSPNPWSIQLLDLCALSNTCHPERNEGPASPAGSRTIFTPAPNQPGSVLPHMATGEPSLFFIPSPTLSSRPERSAVERPASPAGRLIFASEADGWVHLYAIDPASASAVALLTPGDYEVEDPIVHGQTIVFASNRPFTSRPIPGAQFQIDLKDMDRRHLWRIDLAQEDATPQAITHGEGIEAHPQVSGDGQTIAALASDTLQPMSPAIVERNGEMHPLHPEATSVSLTLVTPQQVLFNSLDGMHLHGQLFLPATPAHGKRPAILFFHGGPRRQMLLGYPAMDYYSNAYAMNQYLVSRGFIVLSVNYRCGIGYGLDFRQCAGEGAAGGKEYNDVLAAQRYLAARPDVDAKRIGVWGGSYGGYLTALALARNSDLFAAGVDFHGVHEWQLEDNAPTDWLRGSYAEKDALAAKSHLASPMADIAKWHSPILLIHGDNDPEVAYAQTPLLADALRARNAALPKAQQLDVEELVFPDELHGFLLHKDWLAAYTAAAAFFERTLKPEQLK